MVFRQCFQREVSVSNIHEVNCFKLTFLCAPSLTNRETDLLWPGSAATPEVIRKLRKDCGGLLFLAIGNEIGEMFGLPWLQDIHTTAANISQWPVLDQLKTNDLQYDTKSAFTLSLNHRKHLHGYYG